MLKEITNFINEIKPEYFTENLKPSEGLHIKIELDRNGKMVENGYKSYSVNKKNNIIGIENNEEKEELGEYFSIREYYSGYLSMNKAVDSSRKIHSSVPYVLWFKKENIDKIYNRFSDYFEKTKSFSKNEDELINQIETFCNLSLIELIKYDPKFTSETLKDKNYIKVYFNVELDKIIKNFKGYLSNRLFNKNDYNIFDEHIEQYIGLSDFLNGAGEKKLFLKHQTTHYCVNNRISENIAYKIYQFKSLLDSKPKKLPNPLPIFIDKTELNNEMIKLYNKEKIQKYQEIIRNLIEEKKKDIGNYYLIFWAKTKDGLRIFDIDFVSSFKYKMNDFFFQNIMDLRDVKSISINNIFEFEKEIVRLLFSNALIVKTKKNDLIYKYFDDIDQKYVSKIIYQSIIKYRKNFYDMIYKSKFESISGEIIYDIIIPDIIEKIKTDDNFNSTYYIKEKLNILFSFYEKFDKKNKKFGGRKMATKIPEYLGKMKKLLDKNEDYHLSDDSYEFAFAAGQLIYYLIYQSETANKTHSLLEPFISKTNIDQFKIVISRTINQYKHALKFGHRKFEKLVSEVLGYETNETIKNLLPAILAGYFSNCVLFEKNKK